ncbi:MAG: cysteine desulfurase [Nitrospina sp.]|jgi:cysteine desulfurase|nr:cysteine desulfurase [Nitrospina sp.]
MAPQEIYLDNNATTQPLLEVREEMMKVLGESFGNPSSAHGAGDRARGYLAKARDNVANLIGGDPSNLIFTGSGTEANNMVLMSFCSEAKIPSQIITTSVEHSSILKTCDHLSEKGTDVIYLEVDSSGLINLQKLENLISDKTSIVSIQWVNNETGVIQPIEKILKICRSKGIPFHTDAAQAVGKVPIDINIVDIDFLTLTGHKFHAPPGVGVVYSKPLKQLRPIIFGGGQEFKLRPGTENLPGIVGIGKAAELKKEGFSNNIKKVTALRDYFEEKIFEAIPNTKINGNLKYRSGNSTNILFHGMDGKALVARLDQLGIRCSQSSACTNMRPEPSYVLRAMGLSQREAYSSIRFSFSEVNTLEEVDLAVEAISKLCEELRPISELLYSSQ